MKRDRQYLLQSSFLFAKLDKAELDALVAVAALKSYRAGQVVFTKGGEADRLYAITSGRVRIVSSDLGNEVTLRLIDSGEVFGEIGVLDRGVRTATAIADTSSDLLVLSREKIVAILAARAPLALKLLEAVASRLRSTTELLEDTLFLNVPARLAKKLLALSEAYGHADSPGDPTVIRITQESLGSLIATSRVSVNQQLRTWQEEGVIDLKRGKVVLLKPEALEGVAEGIED